MKVCSKCEIEKEDSEFWKRNNRKSGVNSECKECAKVRRTTNYKENAQEFRDKRKIYYSKNREKLAKGQIESQKGNVRYRKYQNRYLMEKRKSGDKKFLARHILFLAVKGGMIIRPEACSQCNEKEKIEGHHYDYDKPLDVIWLCQGCHRALHRKLKNEVENANQRISKNF